MLVSGFVGPSVVRADEGISVTDLGVVNSRAAALDDVGQVVGTEFEAPAQGFLWDAGAVTPLAIDGASDINNTGQIVGYRLS